MTELITYHAGACGDFIRYLLVKEGSRVLENGRVENDKCFDFTRKAFDSIKANEDIDLVISKIKRKIKNTKLDMCPYITGHDFWVFVSRYGGGTEFFDYVDKLDISRVLYLSTTTEKSLRIATLNTMIKNQNKGYDNYIEFIDQYGESKLEQYKNEAKIYLDSKRDCDIMLEVECIYDKEYLRNFLKNNYVSWSDTNYDVLYDYYMSKQPLSI